MPPASEGWRRLHPLTPVVRAGRFGLFLAAFALQQRDLHSWKLAGGVAVLAAVAVPICWWAWRHTGYRVGADELEMRTGILFRSHRRVPLARLESLDVARPMLARLVGLAELRAEVVSQGRTEVRLSYLPDGEAVAVRDELMARRSGLEAPAEAPAGEDAAAALAAPDGVPIVQVPAREIVLGYVAAPAGFFVISVLPFLVLGAAYSPGAGLAAGLAVLGSAAVGFIPILMAAEKLYGFTLSDVPDGLRIRRGLLNELVQTVPVGRIQAVRVAEPAFWRPFGRARLLVDVAGYGAGRTGDRQTSILLPIAPMPVVEAVVARILPGLRLDRLEPVPPSGRARWRAPVRWRSFQRCWTPTHAITRRGLMWRRTDAVPHLKAQSLRITAGPWQRALGLATLHVDSVGRNVETEARHRDAAEAEQLLSESRAAADI